MVRVGILGLGAIAPRVAQGVVTAQGAELYAVCSRSLDKAEAFAKEHGASMAYGDLEAFLADEDLDLVYIATPNHLHKEQIMQALSYGKHVVCEKPMLLDEADLAECFVCAKEQGCFLMEAHKTVFTPLNLKLFDLLQAGAIGQVHFIEAQYASDALLQENALHDWLQTPVGGCLNDIGVYPIVYANRMANSPVREVKISRCVEKAGFTSQAQLMLTYDNGIMAHLATSWLAPMENTAHIYGEKGRIHCQNFWKSDQLTLVKDGREQIIKVDMKTDFTGEIEHACVCIEQGLLESPIMSYEASCQIVKILNN